MLALMTEWAKIPANEYVFVENSGNFKTSLNIKTESAELNEKITEITKRVLSLNLQYWAKKTENEQWYSGKKSLFGKDYTAELKELFKENYSRRGDELETMTNRDEIVKSVPSFGEIANSFRLKTMVFESPIEKSITSSICCNMPTHETICATICSGISTN